MVLNTQVGQNVNIFFFPCQETIKRAIRACLVLLLPSLVRAQLKVVPPFYSTLSVTKRVCTTKDLFAVRLDEIHISSARQNFFCPLIIEV